MIESSAIAAQTYKSGQRPNVYIQGKKEQKDLRKEKMSRQCTHYKGKGHTIDQLFKIIGYSEWYNAIKASKGSNHSTGGGKLVANDPAEEKNLKMHDIRFCHVTSDLYIKVLVIKPSNVWSPQKKKFK